MSQLAGPSGPRFPDAGARLPRTCAVSRATCGLGLRICELRSLLAPASLWQRGPLEERLSRLWHIPKILHLLHPALQLATAQLLPLSGERGRGPSHAAPPGRGSFASGRGPLLLWNRVGYVIYVGRCQLVLQVGSSRDREAPQRHVAEVQKQAYETGVL